MSSLLNLKRCLYSVHIVQSNCNMCLFGLCSYLCVLPYATREMLIKDNNPHIPSVESNECSVVMQHACDKSQVD